MSKLHLILLPSSLLFSMALAAGGCDSEEIGDPELVGLSEEVVEIVENLELAGYPREEIEIDDQEVIVGGDASSPWRPRARWSATSTRTG